MPDEQQQRPRRAAKIALVFAAVSLLVVAHQTGILDQFANPAEVKRSLLRLGPWGYVAYLAAYALLQPFGVPGTIFVWAAPLIWPWPVAFALSMTGTMAASVIGFTFARFVARDWVASKLPERFRRYDEALEKRGFATVALLRFIFWMPPLLHAFFGVSNVRFSTHFWGSLAGYLLPLLLVSYFGERLFDWLYSLPPTAWVAAAATMLIVVFVRYRTRKRPT